MNKISFYTRKQAAHHRNPFAALAMKTSFVFIKSRMLLSPRIIFSFFNSLSGNGFIEGTELDGFLREFVSSANETEVNAEVSYRETRRSYGQSFIHRSNHATPSDTSDQQSIPIIGDSTRFFSIILSISTHASQSD